MYTDHSWTPLIWAAYGSLLLSLLGAIVVVLVAVRRGRVRRGTGAGLLGAGVALAATAGWLWSSSSPVEGGSCLMHESVSLAFASQPQSSADRACIHQGRIRVGLGLALEVTLTGASAAVLRRTRPSADGPA